jgi:hypothetical protein
MKVKIAEGFYLNVRKRAPKDSTCFCGQVVQPLESDESQRVFVEWHKKVMENLYKAMAIPNEYLKKSTPNGD